MFDPYIHRPRTFTRALQSDHSNYRAFPASSHVRACMMCFKDKEKNMKTLKFTDDNTEGYTAEQLNRLNLLLDAEIKSEGLDPANPDDRQEITNIAERIERTLADRQTVAEYCEQHGLTTSASHRLNDPVVTVEEQSDHYRLYTQPGYYVIARTQEGNI